MNKVSVFSWFSFSFRTNTKTTPTGNAYFDQAEIWYTYRVTKGNYKNLIRGLSDRNLIKTHGSVSCGQRKQGVHKWEQVYLRFSRIYRSVIFYLKNTKFAVKVPAYNWKLHSKVEVNHASRFRDTSDQSFGFCSSLIFTSFRTNSKIPLTRECMPQSSWNLAHVQENQRQI